MSFADTVRAAVALADKLTSSGQLQESVVIHRWRSQNVRGEPVYAPALTLGAVVSHSAARVRTTTGEETVSSAQVSFLTPIPALSPAVAGREEPIDKRDRIVLPSGRSGPILRTDGGLTDPATGRGYVVKVYLG